MKGHISAVCYLNSKSLFYAEFCTRDAQIEEFQNLWPSEGWLNAIAAQGQLIYQTQVRHFTCVAFLMVGF